MEIIIDGYNALFGSVFDADESSTKDLEKIKDQFLERLKAFLPIKMTVVFDAQNFQLSRIDCDFLIVVYTQQNQSADDYIVEYLMSAKYKKQNMNTFLVVSNDKKVLLESKELGARTKNLSQFFKRRKESISENKPMGSNEVEKYEKVFEKRYKDKAE